MITIRESVNIKPVCHHCEEEISDVLAVSRQKKVDSKGIKIKREFC